VFEAALTFETLDEKGRPRQFGSVAGGGRYDDLVRRFTGQDVPACGASIGVDRLLAALRTRRADDGSARADGPVVVTVMDRDRLGEYHAMAAELRAAGIPAEVFMGTAGFQKQLKYADKRSSPVAVIAGGDEFERGEVQVKDLVAGAQRSDEVTDRDEWRADRSAQQTVARADLVATVQAILARDP
jgi:histidyl-tRNA synthetase